MDNNERNLKILEVVNDLIFSNCRAQFQSNTFQYLGENYASIESEIFDYRENENTKVKLCLDLKIKNAEKILSPLVFKILKNDVLSQEEKKIFVILCFVTIEALCLENNFSVFDDIEDLEEIADILYGGYYNCDTSLIFNNRDSISFQEKMCTYYQKFTALYEQDLRSIDINLNPMGIDGEFIGFSYPDFVNSVYSVDITDTNNVLRLLSSSDYNLVLLKQHEVFNKTSLGT